MNKILFSADPDINYIFHVDVGNGYDIQVKLRISATQFFEPDKELEAVDKVS